MALFMMVTIAFFLAITALLWCLSNFNSEIKSLQKPRRPVVYRESDSMPYQRQRISASLRRNLAATKKTGSPEGMSTKVASIVSLVILLGSR